MASYCIASTVCCISLKQLESGLRDGQHTSKMECLSNPSIDEVNACSPHLAELVELCKPKLVVLLGDAKDYFQRAILASDTQLATLRHPNQILRKGGVNSLEFKTFLSNLELALQNANIPHFNCFDAVPMGVN